MEHVFDPEEDGSSSPKTVVLQGYINGPILDVIPVYPEKLLFILDGFPELQYPVCDQEEDLSANLQEKKPAEILWFTDAEKKAYFLSQFSGANAAMRVFYGLRENEGLDIMSALPIISWMICRVLQSQGDGDRTLMRPFQLRNLPVSPLHLLCQALRNPYCKIKDLKLIFCHLTASCGRDLSLVFETNQYLTDLEFVKNTLEDSGMKLLCEGLKQPNCILQTLRLYRCLISSASCGALAAVLSTNQWLTELEFSETKLEASALKLLCDGLKDPNCKLQKLNLSTCYLTGASCVELSSFLQVSQTLKELFVFANALGDTGVQHLCEGLQHANGVIENLVLSECSLSAACCKSLAQVLSSTRSLTKLLLINNKIEDLGLKLLCEGLKQPDCQLKDLALWTCHLTGECCQDLCNALYTNEHLRDLDLSDNALGDEGMQVLCEGLKHPSCKLQTLWLAECYLTDACCGALASVLSRNENLTLLDLSGNDLRDFGVQMLCDALIHPICKLQTF
ncbi:hypothetical protein CB1_002684003 [Camelus ferus]|nr:hypothetical protein CB1_002684003 [Camelus ferus]